MDHLTHAESLTADEAALFRRALAAVEARPTLRPGSASSSSRCWPTASRDVREANESLAREVQERRLVELALRDSEARLRDLALTTADWVWEVDANGRYTSCSDRVTDVLGFRAR